MITGEGIHEVEKLMLGGCISDQVNLWQRKIVFWVDLVEISEINTHSPLPLFLGATKTLLSQSVPYDIGLDELNHFFFYDFLTFKGELYSFLENKGMVEISEQLVNDDLGIYS